MDWILALGTLGLAVLTAVNVRLTREVIRSPWRSVFRLVSFQREGHGWVAEIENLGPGPAAGGAPNFSRGHIIIRHRTVCGERRALQLTIDDRHPGP